MGCRTISKGEDGRSKKDSRLVEIISQGKFQPSVGGSFEKCCHFRVRTKEKLNYCRWGEPKSHLTPGRGLIMVNIWQLAWSCYHVLTVVIVWMNISDKRTERKTLNHFKFLAFYILSCTAQSQTGLKQFATISPIKASVFTRSDGLQLETTGSTASAEPMSRT